MSTCHFVTRKSDRLSNCHFVTRAIAKLNSQFLIDMQIPENQETFAELIARTVTRYKAVKTLLEDPRNSKSAGEIRDWFDLNESRLPLGYVSQHYLEQVTALYFSDILSQQI
ncbi:hypothetical protein [Nostoc sp. FACHB-190]|uniref:hypothetical protein n=1 Tax=Nostoc sp. FACHB-190 TaxID=2692838 RepID=UPI001685D438|nr:hypothetical protein [Nostoc sp. FACHB-190]